MAEAPAQETTESVEASIWAVDSPVGRLGLASTDAGLLRLSYMVNEGKPAGFDELASALRAASAGVSIADVSITPAPFEEVRRQLDDYFAGQLKRFTLPLDWRASKGFYHKVHRIVFGIPYGQVRSYGDIALEAGNAAAARAVGQAMAKNPLSLIVPCHRVVNSDGSRGNYGGGKQAKDYLLDLESGAAEQSEASETDRSSP